MVGIKSALKSYGGSCGSLKLISTSSPPVSYRSFPSPVYPCFTDDGFIIFEGYVINKGHQLCAPAHPCLSRKGYEILYIIVHDKHYSLISGTSDLVGPSKVKRSSSRFASTCFFVPTIFNLTPFT